MELALLLTGVVAAIVAGAALAAHKHELHEGAEKISTGAVLTAVGLTIVEAWKEWDDWQKSTIGLHGHFGKDLKWHADPPTSPPDLWAQLKHIGGTWLLEVTRDMLVSGVVFGLLFLILRAAKNRPAGAA